MDRPAYFKSFSLCLLTISILALATSNVYAATLNVDINDLGCNDVAGTPYCKIQAAIDAASDGDIIEVADGTYMENLTITSKDLSIQGAGQEQTIIDGSNTATAIIINDSKVTIDDVTIQNGKTNDHGGGILLENTSTLVLSDSLVADNIADADSMGGGGDDSGNGGGIYLDAASSLTLNTSQVKRNHAQNGGGIFSVDGPITINDSTINDDNEAINNGGGILAKGMLTMDNSTISGNSSGNLGGGLVNQSGNSTVTNSTISGNHATIGGGGFIADSPSTFSNTIFDDNSAGDSGGAIVLDGDVTTLLTLTNCTISNNTVGVNGGGIAMGTGEAVITNTTISGNKANEFGGGIANSPPILGQEGSVFLDHVTVANNTADADSVGGGGDSVGDGGGIYNNPGAIDASVTLKSTIVADNIDPSSNPDCFGTLNSEGFNLIEDATSPGCDFTPLESDITGEDPLLDALGDNGGPTLTHALGSGSMAIDNGNCTDILDMAVTEDQRGSPRPVGDDCDIGAFEFACGNGAVNLGEECDDGNTDSGDGCSSSCELEAGFDCSGEPTDCNAVCGDNVIVGNEECDDGNTSNDDGCDSSCKLESPELCGNGRVDAGETCDDGNTDDGDGCSSTCQTEGGGDSGGDSGGEDDGDGGCSLITTAHLSSNHQVTLLLLMSLLGLYWQRTRVRYRNHKPCKNQNRFPFF